MSTHILVILVAVFYALVAFVSSALFSASPVTKTTSTFGIMFLGMIWPFVYLVALWFTLVDFFERRQGGS